VTTNLTDDDVGHAWAGVGRESVGHFTTGIWYYCTENSAHVLHGICEYKFAYSGSCGSYRRSTREKRLRHWNHAIDLRMPLRMLPNLATARPPAKILCVLASILLGNVSKAMYMA